jgi:hypothetical protein
MKWFIPDCYWHSRSSGVFPSHEAVCILNTNPVVVVVNLTLYFEDRDKLGGYSVEVGPERTLHIRLDKLVNKDGIAVPQDTPYATVIECELEIAVQYTRVDTSQPAMALMTTMV